MQAASFECLARSPKPFPLLILLEVQCLAGLLPDPTGKGPREALQPAIAEMVRQREDDDAAPLLTPGAMRHLVPSPMRLRVVTNPLRVEIIELYIYICLELQ